MVGDPTGRSKSRPPLTRDEVRAAAETYQQQAFKIFDKGRTEVRYNSEWLDKFTPTQMVELCAKYTVARMLERNDFAKRFQENTPIFVHEFMYPLLQAYDSVELEADVELGGTDQLFNLLVGRDLMPRYGKPAQIVMTTPILEGIDARVVDGKIVGAKMSKSADNYIGINEPPKAMLDKVMLVDDQVIWRYMELLSARTNQEIAELRAAVDKGEKSIIAVKELFAVEIVARFHAQAEADAALEQRHKVARGDAFPAEAPTVEVAADGESIGIGKALAVAGLAESSSEGARLVKGGAVHVDGAVFKDDKGRLSKGRTYEVRVGSKNRKFARLVIA